MKCKYCDSENTLNYYIKPDGDNITIEYWRCNDCIECWHIKIIKYEK